MAIVKVGLTVILKKQKTLAVEGGVSVTPIRLRYSRRCLGRTWFSRAISPSIWWAKSSIRVIPGVEEVPVGPLRRLLRDRPDHRVLDVAEVPVVQVGNGYESWDISTLRANERENPVH